MEKEEDALHFASCRELSYIDYHQGAVQKQQSIAIEVMTPLYLDGARVSTLQYLPRKMSISWQPATVWLRGKLPAAGVYRESVCTMMPPG